MLREMCSVSPQGMRKHKLLREDILPAMATNRKVQRLLNEFMDLLSEYASAEANIEHETPIAQPCPLLADKAESVPSGTNHVDPIPATTDAQEAVPAGTDQKDNDLVVTGQANSSPRKTDRVDLNTPPTDEMNLSPQAKDVGS